MGEFSGRTAFVTGSGRNLGRAAILEFTQRGANVVVHAARNRDEAESVAQEARAFGVEAMTVVGDQVETELPARWREEINARFGHVDVLVCNAAVRAFQSFWETTFDDWDHYLSLNLSSAFRLAKTIRAGHACFWVGTHHQRWRHRRLGWSVTSAAQRHGESRPPWSHQGTGR